MGTRPRAHVPGEVNRTSRDYLTGSVMADHVHDVRPGDLLDELRRHEAAIREADAGPSTVPYPGQYDGFHGFAERARHHLKITPERIAHDDRPAADPRPRPRTGRGGPRPRTR